MRDPAVRPPDDWDRHVVEVEPCRAHDVTASVDAGNVVRVGARVPGEDRHPARHAPAERLVSRAEVHLSDDDPSSLIRWR